MSKVNFFDELNIQIIRLGSDKISMRMREWYNPDRYFEKLAEKIDEAIKNANFLGFWARFGELYKPQPEDLKALKTINSYYLSNIHMVLCRSLQQLVLNDMEHEETAQILHEYYLLTQQEINNRPDMPTLTNKDEFLEEIANKEQNQELRELLKNARRTGKICVFCHSREVKSYNKDEWKCHTCGKRFRKQ